MVLGLFTLSSPVWCLGVVCVVLYLYWTKYHYGKFKRMGVPYRTPYPIVGSTYDILKSFMRLERKQYNEFPGVKCFGIFQGPTPILMVKDKEMLKQIMVKEHLHFQDRFSPAEFKPFNRSLSMLKGAHWKHVRNILTPTFSAGKLKRMIQAINKCANNFVENIETYAKAGDKFHPKGIAGAYTMDVIGATAFGLNINSQKDPNNDFLKYGKKMVDVNFTDPLLLIAFFVPSLMKLLEKCGLQMMDKKVETFFTQVIEETCKKRKDSNWQQVDFMQLMLDAQVDQENEKAAKEGRSSDPSIKTDSTGIWSETGLVSEDIFGQALAFFFAGFDTVSVSIGCTLYLLALNQECQQKLYEEIDSVLGDKESIEYDDVVGDKLPYLDCCFSETLRLYPPAPRMDRVCNEATVIEGVHIPKGMVIGLPFYALMMDEEVWEDPEKYDPERHRPENKADRDIYQYMPFGQGPRNCIGMRLAQIEAKIALVKLIRKFKMVPCDITQMEYLVPKQVNFIHEPGFNIKAEIRD